jgi:hypothetical protein
MVRRRVSLLFLLYVTLDFSNPLLPGAVSFDDGSFKVVKANRGRPAAVVPDTVPPSESAIERVLDVQVVRGSSPAADLRRPAVIRIRRAPLPSSDLASSPEDH